jgi:hypothetical protein
MRVLILAWTSSIAALLMGCTPTWHWDLSYDQPLLANSVQIIDVREEAEKQFENMSYLVTSCSYGIWRIGDAQIVPDRVAYLADQLGKKAPDKVQGKSITLSKFDVFNNGQANVRKENTTGLIESALSNSSCVGDETVPGGFRLSENPDFTTVIVSEIVIDIGEDTKKVRGVMPYELVPKGVDPGVYLGVKARELFDKMIDDLVAQL